ncbi:putative reverse transcriptase domain-containing protein [Tanacetum coccineum]
MAYKLELPKELNNVHSTFHISNLKKCLSDKSLVIPIKELRLDDKLNFVEEPVEIMDREVKQLKQSRIPIIKVRWNSKRGPEFTWEREDQIRANSKLIKEVKKVPKNRSKAKKPREEALQGKVYCDDSDLFTDFETDFPDIVYNDASTSNQNVSFEPTVNKARGPKDPQTPPVPQDEDEREPMFVQAHDPDYVPEPIYPEYIPLEDEHEFPAEEQPLPPVDSPTAESPGYVTKSDPEEDPEEYEDDETEDGLVDYPMDGGDDGDDDDGDSSGDDADGEDEDDDEEEEEHLASADSAIIVPVDEPIFPHEGTEPVIPPPFTNITIGARITVRPQTSVSLPPEAEVERLLAMTTPSPSPPISPSIGERLVRSMAPLVTAALPSIPLPPLPPSLYIPPPVDLRDDIPKSEQPPRKRLYLSTLGSIYEVGKSSTARPTRGRGIDYGFVSTIDAEERRQGTRDVGYGIIDTWVDSVEAVPEIAPMTVGEMTSLSSSLDTCTPAWIFSVFNSSNILLELLITSQPYTLWLTYQPRILSAIAVITDESSRVALALSMSLNVAMVFSVRLKCDVENTNEVDHLQFFDSQFPQSPNDDGKDSSVEDGRFPHSGNSDYTQGRYQSGRHSATQVDDQTGLRLDVNNAFLYGDLVEDVYTTLSDGYNDEDESKVCKLNKSLYDLNQASRQWNGKLTTTLAEHGFEESKFDYYLYTKHHGDKFVAFLTPDISYAVHCLSQHMHTPLQSHFKATLRVLRYLKGSPGCGIQFYNHSNFKLKAYADADWAKCPKTKRSITGFCVFLGKSLVSWKSKKQATISKSSSEAELPVELCCDNSSAIQIAANPFMREQNNLSLMFIFYDLCIHSLFKRLISSGYQSSKSGSLKIDLFIQTLGISVVFNSEGMLLSQHKYAVEILVRAYMVGCALQYLTFIQLDRSYAIHQVCLFIHDPREPYFLALKRILHYIGLVVLLLVGIKSLLNVVSITAALIEVNAAQSKLYKVNAAEGVNTASEEVTTTKLVSTAYLKEFDLLKWDQQVVSELVALRNFSRRYGSRFCTHGGCIQSSHAQTRDLEKVATSFYISNLPDSLDAKGLWNACVKYDLLAEESTTMSSGRVCISTRSHYRIYENVNVDVHSEFFDVHVNELENLIDYLNDLNDNLNDLAQELKEDEVHEDDLNVNF